MLLFYDVFGRNEKVNSSAFVPNDAIPIRIAIYLAPKRTAHRNAFYMDFLPIPNGVDAGCFPDLGLSLFPIDLNDLVNDLGFEFVVAAAASLHRLDLHSDPQFFFFHLCIVLSMSQG